MTKQIEQAEWEKAKHSANPPDQPFFSLELTLPVYISMQSHRPRPDAGIWGQFKQRISSWSLWLRGEGAR